MTDCIVFALGFAAVYVLLCLVMALAQEAQRWRNMRRRERMK